MPKGNPLYTDRLDFFVSRDMRRQIIAISFLMETKGKHAPAARNLLNKGIKGYLESLNEKLLKEYEFILSRVTHSEPIDEE